MKLDIWINMYAICGLIFMLSAMRKYPCHVSIKSDYKTCVHDGVIHLCVMY